MPPTFSQPKAAAYCFERPQYFCTPSFQQPVLPQLARRAPQLVRQIEIDAWLGLFLQPAMQALSSPLHFIGSASAGVLPTKASAAIAKIIE